MASIAETLIQTTAKSTSDTSERRDAAISNLFELQQKKEQLALNQEKLANQKQMLGAKRDGQAMDDIELMMKMSPNLKKSYKSTLMRRAEERGAPLAQNFVDVLSGDSLNATAMAKANAEFKDAFQESMKLGGKATPRLIEAKAAFANAAYGGDTAPLTAFEDKAIQENLVATAKASEVAVKQTEAEEKQTVDRTKSLRQEVEKNSVTVETRALLAAHDRIKILKNNTAAADITGIFAFMKMIDPESTVREGEFATAASAAGIPERLRTQYNKILKGDRLGPDQRKDFMRQADDMMQNQLNRQQPISARFAKIAANTPGVNVDQVTDPSLFNFEPAVGAKKVKDVVISAKQEANIAARVKKLRASLPVAKIKSQLEAQFPNFSASQINKFMKESK